MSAYQETIRQILSAARLSDVDPRHVEAYMRLEIRTLDGIPARHFRALALDCAAAVIEDPALAEDLAKTYSL